MTDAEINLAIAKIEYPDAIVTPDKYHWIVRVLVEDDELALDYCNDWADIGPIIERERIHSFYDPETGLAGASIRRNKMNWIVLNKETPTKAAALCYLKMKGFEI
jgi:hypothetical protein